jgi:[acyl-carrier-protein] S-malonyltransferase
MIAFTFPGQGSQRPAMGAPWQGRPSWELVERASDATGRDVARLLLHADADELRATQHAQLSTFVLSLVVHDAVQRLGLHAGFAAGHSLGEYSALVAAGALSFDDGARLVAERGDAMREASEAHVGTMAAVLGLDDEGVDAACADVDDAWVANFNAPGQVVIAGAPDALEAAGAAAKTRGAKRVMPVAVSGAFHTPYMAPAQQRLDAALARAAFSGSTIPVASNVDAALHQRADEWADLLSRQLCSPVRWRQLLVTLRDAGVDTFVELGPGTVLTGMAKRAVDGATTLSASGPDELDALADALGDQRSAMEGEHLDAVERLVVSPAAGVFAPEPDLAGGIEIRVGDVVGRVGEHEVRSRFAGWLVGLLAHRGERVTPSQPVAWLRVAI